MPTDQDEINQKRRLIEIVRDAIQRDDALREQYQVGEKFRFVRDRLRGLLEQLEKHLEISEKEEKDKEKGGLSEDEMEVYIYLYNAKGIVLQSWRNMLTPKLFYEYSVNRPAYTTKSHIEALIRSKTNIEQHAYLSVAVKKSTIISSTEEKKDAIGNPVVKVKEGALLFEKLISITHNGHEYVLNGDGQFEKKTK